MTTASETGGFTLMEVMVSMAIIALVLVSLFRLQSGAVDLAGADQFQNLAPLAAKMKLAEIEAQLGELTGETEDVEISGDGYQGSCRITDVDFPEIMPDKDQGRLRKIELVMAEPRGGRRSFRLTTFRYVPGN
ncbi:MAG: prepilin-type N-terminal cleavage/methylation domain-containing protein [Desulfobacteraceae bacterium]|nr:prepilin-type N-terminal cleavage/methylation domain-containing protein [Desulfobacteraceae bacterium]